MYKLLITGGWPTTVRTIAWNESSSDLAAAQFADGKNNTTASEETLI